MISFLQEIPNLIKSFSQKRTKCLLFNYDVLGHSDSVDINHIKQIVDLADPPQRFTGFISQRSLAALKAELPQNLILAGANGVEIDGPGFLWNFPRLGMLRHQIDQIITTLAMEIGPEWARKNIGMNGLELSISIPENDQFTANKLSNLVRHNLSGTLLGATMAKKKIRIYPNDQWDRRLFIQKIANLLPNENGLTPTIFYFGASVADEPAFRETNLHGYSVLLRENIGRRTVARYYLRSKQELNKVLIWFNSQ